MSETGCLIPVSRYSTSHLASNLCIYGDPCFCQALHSILFTLEDNECCYKFYNLIVERQLLGSAWDPE